MRRKTGDLLCGPQHYELSPETSDLEDIISGALFDFMGKITGGQDLLLGERHSPYDLLEEFSEWANERGLQIHNAEVENWHQRIANELYKVASLIKED